MEEYKDIQWLLPDMVSVDVNNLAEHIVRIRGDDPQDFFNLDYGDLGDPYLLPDMEEAIRHLLKIRDQKRKVAIYGDYDIDGLTATTLLLEAFTSFGFDVMSYIPDRFEEGYGLHTPALRNLHELGVDTVVTVDCGISANEAIDEASKMGLHIIVTDHHTVPAVEPKGAIALINPLRSINKYPQTTLAGVGVAFALVRALQKHQTDRMPIGQEKWLLDLVALGTICDAVPLIGENRRLTQYGLKVARRGRRPGFRALAGVSDVVLADINASDFGFRFGPRLNAAGRLENAKIALELLVSDDIIRARQTAEQLDELNRHRRRSTESIQEEAFLMAEQYGDDSILVISSPKWSHGVAGLVASRTAEMFGKPTIILQEEGDTSKGSARSIGSFSIIEALRDNDALLERYGGHRVAAGMTIRTQNIDSLRTALNEAVNPEQIGQMRRKIKADVWLKDEYLTDAGLEQLRLLEPTGQAHPAPIFFIRSQLTEMKFVGKQQDHAQIVIDVDGHRQRAIAFGARSKWPFLRQGMGLELLLTIRENKWQGVCRPQLEVVGAREYRNGE